MSALPDSGSKTTSLATLVGALLWLAAPGCRPAQDQRNPASEVETIELPEQLRPARDAVDLCPERAACAAAVAGWVARCDVPAGDSGEVGEACYVAGFMTRIVAGPAYQGDPEALTTETLRLHDRACEREHADGCAWSASLRLFRDESDHERARALADARKGCLAGSGAACVMQARALIREPETRAQGEASLVVLCEDRELAQACGDLAYQYLSGDALRESVNDALSFAQRGCGLGGGSSCAVLADIIYSFESLADLGPEALDAAGMACERGFETACATAGVLYDRYRGAVEGWDDARLVDVLDRGCSELEGPAACVLFGILHEAGIGETLPVDFQRASELHRWACEHGDDEGCLRLGVVLSNSEDQQQAEFGRRMVVELCGEGYPPACDLLPPELRGDGH